MSRREGAFLVDCLVWAVLVWELSLQFTMLYVYLLLVLAFPFKDGIGGRSFGKWLFDLQVVDAVTLEPIGYVASFKRNFLISIPWLWIVTAYWVACTLENDARLGDRWAGTKVIWQRYADQMLFQGAVAVCQQCRYNLTGNVSGICPECGTPVARQGAAQAHASR